MSTVRTIRSTVAVALAVAIAGCSGYAIQAPTTQLSPDDFRGPGPAVAPGTLAAATGTGTTEGPLLSATAANQSAHPTPTSATTPAPPTPSPAPSVNTTATRPLLPLSPAVTKAAGAANPPTVLGGDRGYVMDAMVGQVNGRPIYASQIFRDIGEDTLKRIGGSEPRLAFKERAAELIEAKLREKITNALILAEAERGLTDPMRAGLQNYLKIEREKILAQYGGGAPGPAEQALIAAKGHGIAEELEQRRQKALVDKFLHDKFYPKIAVHRREVERYYEDHPEEFNPNPTVTVRVIVVTGHAKADAVDKALQAHPFGDVAKQQSEVAAANGGTMGPFHLSRPMSQFNELKWDKLNEKVRGLKAGEWSDRTDLGSDQFGWIMLQQLQGGKSRTLKQAFLDIEGRLRAMKISRLQRHYISALFRHGNFTPVEEMGNALLDVAMVRFAKPQ